MTRRRAWCMALSSRLEGLPGLSLPRITQGCDPSWWFYLVRVKEHELTATTDQIAEALRAEGIPVGAHYIGTPIYQYPLFREHTAFAHAGHPFAERAHAKGLCPVAEQILDTCIMLGVNEAHTQADLDETALAFQKVFTWYARPRA
ncbi:MAG: DegT/DnrJ/EryC1/StrS family aminotransferase [Tepidisphaeraceae bacterium]